MCWRGAGMRICHFGLFSALLGFNRLADEQTPAGGGEAEEEKHRNADRAPSPKQRATSQLGN
ncbi:hypothetical protein LAD67_13065 [Escherichia coli]|nr:hypothetical protein [Escherichia coli]